jgi:spoIIIJ-associated protein
MAVEQSNQVQHDRGQAWLEQLLGLMALPVAVTSEPNPPFSTDSCWLKIDQSNLSTEQVQQLIGQDGAVLDAIQYLINAILNLGQGVDSQGAFTIELAGYRLQRFAELKAMAEQAAAQVRETGIAFELKSLSSAERRQVHTILKDWADLETQSQGQEPDRRLVIRPVSVQP